MPEAAGVTVAVATRAEVCVGACAEAWRGDGEIVASPMGSIPTAGARLARDTFEPELLLSDGEACFVAGMWALGQPAPGPVEGWIPYRAVFDLAWGGKRHVMMSPSQIERYGNVNISAIGDHTRPKRQLLGVRGAPGKAVKHPTSYWVPRHLPRAFVPRLYTVSGVGYDRARDAGPAAVEFRELRRVVTNLAVLDFGGPDHCMSLVSVHPCRKPGCRRGNSSSIRAVIDPAGIRDQEVQG